MDSYNDWYETMILYLAIATQLVILECNFSDQIGSFGYNIVQYVYSYTVVGLTADEKQLAVLSDCMHNNFLCDYIRIYGNFNTEIQKLNMHG